MSDRFYNTVCIPPCDEALFDELEVEHPSSEYELEENYTELRYEEMSYSDTEALATWLKKQNLPFLIFVDPKYEFMGEVYWWQPGMESHRSAVTDANGCQIILLSEALALSQAELEAIQRPFPVDDLKCVYDAYRSSQKESADEQV